MIDFINIDFSIVSLCEVTVKIMEYIRDDFSVKNVLFELNQKVKKAKFFLSREKEPKEQLKKLLYLFYNVWNFGPSKKKYKLSNMIWIDSVFKTNTGTAISLGIIFLHIAKILKLSIVPVIFPTQFILRVNNINNEVFFINPFNGEILAQRVLEYWLKGNISPTTTLSLKDISESKPLQVIQKVLDILKISLIEEKSIELALRVSELLLKINPKDPYEIRDRGLICSQLKCYNTALLDLIYFIEHCPDDPVSEIIKVQIHSIQQKKNIMN